MYDLPREQLKYIVTKYGRSIGEDSKRCEGLLRDLCGQHPKEINTIVAAIRERVPADLLSSQGHIPPEVLIGQLIKRLEDRLGITREVAQWTVESWALAFEIIQVASTLSYPPSGEGDSWIDPSKDPIFLLKIGQSNHKIRNSWIAGITSGSIFLLLAIPSGSFPIFLVSLLTMGFSFGIYKKNIFSALMMPVFSFLSHVTAYGITKNGLVLIQFFVCLYFFVEGVMGVLSYRKLLKVVKSSNI